jgi:hypothetical protein
MRILAGALGLAILAAALGSLPAPVPPAPPGALEVRPRFAYVTAGGRVAFAAGGRAAAWSVAEGAEGGAVDAAGVYTAPAAPGTYHVVATAGAPARTGVAVVGVAAPRGGVVPMPLVSRGVPAHASSGRAPRAVDDDYASVWRSEAVPTAAAPAWIALDLSGLPPARRKTVALSWYGDRRNFDYDLSLSRGPAYDLPTLYTIEGHAAPGRGAPPADGDPGWIVLARVDEPNVLRSRQHLLDLAPGGRPLSWLRIRITASGAAPGHEAVALNLDVHDAARGPTDDWIFFGSSSTGYAMSHDPRAGVCPAPCPWGRPGPFGALVERARGSFPLQEGAGQAGFTAARASLHLPRWLAAFPGRFVALAYGANDARAVPECDAACADEFEARYEEMIRAVLDAGKVPIVPTIPWGARPRSRLNVPVLNERIRALWARYPAVVPGPDFWALTEAHPELIAADGLHPTPLGALAYRNAWAQAMLASVYAKR